MNLIRLSQATIAGFEGLGADQVTLYQVSGDVYINPYNIVFAERVSGKKRLKVSKEVADKGVTLIYMVTGEQLVVSEHPEEILSKIDHVNAFLQATGRW